MTLATNDSYSLGALVVAHSLKKVSTQHQLAVMITPDVSESMRSKLNDVFDLVQVVDVLDSKDAANLAVLKRPELGITFTKLHCWNLIQFDKCVFLDADVVVSWCLHSFKSVVDILFTTGSSKLRRAFRAWRVVSCSRCGLARLLQLGCLCLQTKRRHVRQADPIRWRIRKFWW